MLIQVAPGQSLQTVIDTLPADDQPVTIHLAPGVYEEKIALRRPRTCIEGESAETTRITWHDGAAEILPDGKKRGTFRTATLLINARDCALRNVTVENSAYPREQVGQALFEHLPPRLRIRYVFHLRNRPELAVTDPEHVNHQPIKPVHDLQKQHALSVCRPEVRDAIPDANHQHRRNKQQHIQRNHAVPALLLHRCAVNQPPRNCALLKCLRVEVQPVDGVIPDRDLHNQPQQKAVQNQLNHNRYGDFLLVPADAPMRISATAQGIRPSHSSKRMSE